MAAYLHIQRVPQLRVLLRSESIGLWAYLRRRAQALLPAVEISENAEATEYDNWYSLDCKANGNEADVLSAKMWGRHL